MGKYVSGTSIDEDKSEMTTKSSMCTEQSTASDTNIVYAERNINDCINCSDFEHQVMSLLVFRAGCGI